MGNPVRAIHMHAMEVQGCSLLFVCLLLYDGRQYQALPKSDYPYNFSERNTPELTVLWGKVNKGGH